LSRHENQIPRQQYSGLNPLGPFDLFRPQPALILNGHTNAIEIASDLDGRESQDIQRQISHVLIALTIIFNGLGLEVSFSVHLDHQMCLSTIEIRDGRPDRMLSPKLEAQLAAPQ
jgi:hypothetical protein